MRLQVRNEGEEKVSVGREYERKVTELKIEKIVGTVIASINYGCDSIHSPQFPQKYPS